jgi:hypothetical protein
VAVCPPERVEADGVPVVYRRAAQATDYIVLVYTVFAYPTVDRHFTSREIVLATSAMANGIHGRGGGGRGCGRHVLSLERVIVFV